MVELEFRWYFFVLGATLFLIQVLLLVYGKARWLGYGVISVAVSIASFFLIALAVVDSIPFAAMFGAVFGGLVGTANFFAVDIGLRMSNERRRLLDGMRR